MRRYRSDRISGGAALAVASTLLAHAAWASLPEPTSWIPATAGSIVYVDAASLLSSSAFLGLEESLSAQVGREELEEFRELTGMDPWRDFHALSLFTETGESERWGLAVAGAFDAERVIETLEGNGRGKVARLEHRATTLYMVSGRAKRTTSSDGPHALAFPDGGTALFGPVESVRSMLDVGFGWAPSADEGPLEPALRSLSMGETFWMVSAESTLGADLRARLGRVDDTPVVETFSISVRVGSDIEVRARGELESDEEAGRLADVVRGLAGFAALSAAGGEPTIENLEARALGTWLEVEFEIDAKRVKGWLRDQKKKAPSTTSR